MEYFLEKRSISPSRKISGITEFLALENLSLSSNIHGRHESNIQANCEMSMRALLTLYDIYTHEWEKPCVLCSWTWWKINPWIFLSIPSLFKSIFLWWDWSCFLIGVGLVSSDQNNASKFSLPNSVSFKVFWTWINWFALVGIKDNSYMYLSVITLKYFSIFPFNGRIVLPSC